MHGFTAKAQRRQELSTLRSSTVLIYKMDFINIEIFFATLRLCGLNVFGMKFSYVKNQLIL